MGDLKLSLAKYIFTLHLPLCTQLFLRCPKPVLNILSSNMVAHLKLIQYMKIIYDIDSKGKFYISNHIDSKGKFYTSSRLCYK